MKLSKKLSLLVSFIIVCSLSTSTASAASPDGLGPWADNVVSFSQGDMKNGSSVPAARSITTASLGVAENNTVDINFFSLGFGGNIVLGFDNGISSGVFVVEATNFAPTYPDEKAKIEVSEDGTTWVVAGNVAQDGTVAKPASVTCAKFVRITDISNPAAMPDDIADGYDVDGVRANGDACTSTTPTPTSVITPAPTTPPSSGSNNSGSTNNASSNGSSNSNSSNSSTSNPTSTPNPTVAPAIIAQTFSDNCPQVPNPLVPCFPNTGNLIPRLPDTGIGPDYQYIPWLVVAGILVSAFTFYHVRKKHTFSPKRRKR